MRNKVAKHLRRMAKYNTRTRYDGTHNESPHNKEIYKLMKQAHNSLPWYERISGE